MSDRMRCCDKYPTLKLFSLRNPKDFLTFDAKFSEV